VKRGVLLLVWAAGCVARPPSPFYADADYLKFGLDAQSEADALIHDYAQRDEAVAQRLDGRHFTALGFMTRAGRITRVRVLTLRGIQLALDPEPTNSLGMGADYAVLAAPIADTQDADGDGFEEVFVERRAPNGSCLLVYRVRDVGFVDPVTTSARLFGRDWCPNSAEDLDQDGRTELIIEARLPDFAGEVPHVRVPLWAFAHRFEVQANPPALAQYVAAERAGRLRDLASAQRRCDVASSFRLAIELAALAHVLGDSPTEQVVAFDAALAGVVLQGAQQQLVNAARVRIYADWNESEAGAAAATH
jgi:hypothetical protein